MKKEWRGWEGEKEGPWDNFVQFFTPTLTLTNSANNQYFFELLDNQQNYSITHGIFLRFEGVDILALLGPAFSRSPCKYPHRP